MDKQLLEHVIYKNHRLLSKLYEEYKELMDFDDCIKEICQFLSMFNQAQLKQKFSTPETIQADFCWCFDDKKCVPLDVILLNPTKHYAPIDVTFHYKEISDFLAYVSSRKLEPDEHIKININTAVKQCTDEDSLTHILKHEFIHVRLIVADKDRDLSSYKAKRSGKYKYISSKNLSKDMLKYDKIFRYLSDIYWIEDRKILDFIDINYALSETEINARFSSLSSFTKSYIDRKNPASDSGLVDKIIKQADSLIDFTQTNVAIDEIIHEYTNQNFRYIYALATQLSINNKLHVNDVSLDQFIRVVSKYSFNPYVPANKDLINSDEHVRKVCKQFINRLKAWNNKFNYEIRAMISKIIMDKGLYNGKNYKWTKNDIDEFITYEYDADDFIFD